MAQIRAEFALSTSTVSSEALGFSTVKLLSVKNPAIQSQVAEVASDADTDVVTPAAGEAAYLYVYKMDATNYISIKLGGAAVLRV